MVDFDWRFSDEVIETLGTKFELYALQKIFSIKENGDPESIKQILDFLYVLNKFLVNVRPLLPILTFQDTVGNRYIGLGYDPKFEKAPYKRINRNLRIEDCQVSGITNFYRGNFFGKDNGTLIRAIVRILYSGDMTMRPPIWRYVTEREPLEHDRERLGI